ncbi:hypothetical protein [Lachnoclostridium sp. Marseille-P6806]|uniref:hypothetical protein n=1 Tax=Lachnoclostridium sp. Marseille-P6806 TaxID=2364793 RepID=UPI0010316455|nr:hypothetical protein [Lachnoclostridium sp. Marseille-P6806]
MSLLEMIQFFEVRRFDDLLGMGGVAAILILSMIQVSKLPMNPWSWLAKHIGRAINGEVIRKVDVIETKVADLKQDIDAERDSRIADMELERAERARTRILRFNDEIVNGTPHTREYFNDVLRDIDTYELYCENHRSYKNSRAVEAVTNIRRVFRRREEKNDFLVGKKAVGE